MSRHLRACTALTVAAMAGDHALGGVIAHWDASALRGAPEEVIVGEADDGPAITLRVSGSLARERFSRLFRLEQGEVPFGAWLPLEPDRWIAPNGASVFRIAGDVIPVPLTGFTPSEARPARQRRAAAVGCPGSLRGVARLGRLERGRWLNTWEFDGPRLDSPVEVDAVSYPVVSSNCLSFAVTTPDEIVWLPPSARVARREGGRFRSARLSSRGDTLVGLPGDGRSPALILGPRGRCSPTLGFTPSGAEFDSAGAEVTFWSHSGDVTRVRLRDCTIRSWALHERDGSRPHVTSLRPDASGIVAVLSRPLPGSEARHVVIAMAEGRRPRCVKYPLIEARTVATLPSIAIAQDRRVFVWSHAGAAVLEFKTRDARTCDGVYMESTSRRVAETQCESRCYRFEAGAEESLLTWPLAPRDAPHVVATSPEYIGGSVGFHEGVDIRAVPYFDAVQAVDPSGTDVLLPTPAWVCQDTTVCIGGDSCTPVRGACCEERLVTVVGMDGRYYVLGHLELNTATQELANATETSCEPLPQGTPVGRVRRWDEPCEFHHLHYRIGSSSGMGTENPFDRLSPRGDDQAPLIESVGLVRLSDDVGVQPGTPLDQTARLVVSVSDVGDHPSTTAGEEVGIRSIDAWLERQDASTGASSEIGRYTVDFSAPFERKVGGVDFGAFVRRTGPCTSVGDYCGDKVFCLRPLTLRPPGGAPSPDPNSVDLDAGNYRIRVTVTDYAGLSAVTDYSFDVAPAP